MKYFLIAMFCFLPLAPIYNHFKSSLKPVALLGAPVADGTPQPPTGLLGLTPSYPQIDAGSPNSLTYTASTGLLVIQSFPTDWTGYDTGFGPNGIVDPPTSMQLQVTLNSSGALLGGVTGDDFVLTGNLIDFETGYEINGTLLTGEIIDYGFSNGGTDLFEFKLQTTGGLLATETPPGASAPPFQGEDSVVNCIVTGSSFSGDFSVNFTGDPDSNVAVLDCLTHC